MAIIFEHLICVKHFRRCFTYLNSFAFAALGWTISGYGHRKQRSSTALRTQPSLVNFLDLVVCYGNSMGWHWAFPSNVYSVPAMSQAGETNKHCACPLRAPSSGGDKQGLVAVSWGDSGEELGLRGWPSLPLRGCSEPFLPSPAPRHSFVGSSGIPEITSVDCLIFN